MQAHRWLLLTRLTQSLGKAKASKRTQFTSFHCNTQQVLITLLFQLISMPLMPQWLLGTLTNAIFSSPIYLKSLPWQCLFVQPKLCSKLKLAHSYQNMKWILKVDPRIWISDTNCSENMRRNECLAYHWTKFISFDTLELTLVINWCRFTGSRWKDTRVSISYIKCVCVLLLTCQTELIQGPLEILWLKCMYNSSWGHPLTLIEEVVAAVFTMEQRFWLIFLSILILKTAELCANSVWVLWN